MERVGWGWWVGVGGLGLVGWSWWVGAVGLVCWVGVGGLGVVGWGWWVGIGQLVLCLCDACPPGDFTSPALLVLSIMIQDHTYQRT